MRVIAGSARGVRLAPVPSGVRPVSDMAREGVFSSLGDGVAGGRVLDLYAGTGALGIEALSRGAERALFVERNRGAQRVINENLRRASVQDRAQVVPSDVLRFLGRASDLERFDLVFADPPYATDQDEVDRLVRGLAGGWLRPGWAVVLTRPSRAGAVHAPDRWEAARRLAYGDTAVVIYRETPPEGSTGVSPLSFK